MIDIPSPAVAVVGRHNSGKTTLIERLIAELVGRGLDVGSIKHHSHRGFDIDIPGKDSYRHRAAGASETVIAAPGQVARIKTVEDEVECSELVRSMPNHDIIVVEGYRKSGLPTIEIMRSGNEADCRAARLFVKAAREGLPLTTDFTQLGRAVARAGNAAGRDGAGEVPGLGEMPGASDYSAAADAAAKMPSTNTVAVVTDIPEAEEAAALYGIPAIGLEDVAALADFLSEHYVRPRVTVVIQAGGESRRMGQSKATVPFAGRPLICRLVERLSPVADELIITTNEADKLGFLHDMYPDLTIRLVGDAYAERGALPGLYTALAAAENPYVAVVACDMVFASARLVVAEALAMHEPTWWRRPTSTASSRCTPCTARKGASALFTPAPSAGRSACRASSTIRRLRCCPSIRIASWKLSPAAAALSMPTRPMSLLASSSPISANSRKGFAPCRT